MKKIFSIALIISALATISIACEKKENNENGQTTNDEFAGFPDSKPTCAPFTKQIVDGGFEDCWYKQTTKQDSYLEYQSSALMSLNMLHALGDMIPGTISPLFAFCDKATPHSGNYALKLVSGLIRDEQNGTLFVPGAIAPLNENFIDEFLNGGNISIKRPYTEKPTAIKGYFKYIPAESDSASIEVILYKNNDIIASGRLLETNNVENWTAFHIPITGANYANETPTHISIVISSSAGYNFSDLLSCVGADGSTLYIDDIELVFDNQ